MAAWRYEISLQVLKRNFVSPSCNILFYDINTNELLIHFTKGIESCIFIFNHSNSDLFTYEDNMFSRESSLDITLVFI